MPDQSPATQSSSQTQNNNATGAAAAAAAGASKDAWYSRFPEELRVPDVTRYKDEVSLIRSHIALGKKLGTTINPIGPESTDEERNAFYTKLGRPETADKYGFKIPDIVERVAGELKIDPKNFVIDEGFVKSAREAFHASGLSDTQAAPLVEMYLRAQAAALQAEGAKITEGVKALEQEWGHAYESNVAISGRAIERLEQNVPGLGEMLDDPRFGSHPAMIKLMHFLGVAMGEDQAVVGAQKPGEEEGAEIKKKIEAMMNDPKHPLNDQNHPGHKAAVAEKSALYKQLYGDEPARA